MHRRRARSETPRPGPPCRAALTALALLLHAATPSSAEAAPPSPDPAASPAARPSPRVSVRRGRWYGWQGLAGHLLADAGVVVGLVGIHRIAPDDPALSTVPIQLGVLGHAGVGLAVHGSRREWANLGGSLGLSLGLPAAGTIVGLLIAVPSGGLKENAPAPPHLVIGAGIGLHLAGIIDVAGFSFETVREPAKDGTAPPPPQRPMVTPMLLPVQGGAIMGLAGSL